MEVTEEASQTSINSGALHSLATFLVAHSPRRTRGRAKTTKAADAPTTSSNDTIMPPPPSKALLHGKATTTPRITNTSTSLSNSFSKTSISPQRSTTTEHTPDLSYDMGASTITPHTLATNKEFAHHVSTPHPKASTNPNLSLIKGCSEKIYNQGGLSSAAPTEYSSLLESASGKVAQNNEIVAAAKAQEEATTKESEEQILQLHERRQLELSAQSQELSRNFARIEEDHRLLELASFESQARADERERDTAAKEAN